MVSGVRATRDARGSEIEFGPISVLLERVVRSWHPVAIWLFGSRARGEANSESDWDLLVVVPDEVPDVVDPMAAWQLMKDSGVRSDLVPCRTTEFEDARNTPNTLAYEASHHGVLIYGR